MSGQEEGVTLVTGSKKELDENLTEEELQALRALDDTIARQVSPDSLDSETLETLSRIWIVRKTRGGTTPIIKVVWGMPVYKRDDFF